MSFRRLGAVLLERETPKRISGGVFDSFKRSNNTGLGTTDNGQSWLLSNGGFSILNNKAVPMNNGSLNTAYVESNYSDVSITCDYTAGTGNGGGIALRVTPDSGGSWVEAQVVGLGVLRLMRITTGGAFANLASVGISLSNGGTYRMNATAIGSALSVSLVGVPGASVNATHSQNQNVTKHGIYAESTDCGISNYSILPL